MPSKSKRIGKKTYTATKSKRPDGRGTRISLSTYKRKGK